MSHTRSDAILARPSTEQLDDLTTITEVMIANANRAASPAEGVAMLDAYVGHLRFLATVLPAQCLSEMLRDAMDARADLADDVATREALIHSILTGGLAPDWA